MEVMTEKERWEAVLDRQPVDRTPLFLASLGFSLRNVGAPVARAYDDPETSFWAQVRTNEMYGAAHCVRYVGGAFGAREFGGEVRMPREDFEAAPALVRPPVDSEEAIERLESAPPDAATAGAVPLAMRFSELEAQHGFPITLTVGGILTGVGNMCGIERMCRWMIQSPRLLHRACRLMTDFLLGMVRHWVDAFGPDRLLGWNVSPTESNQLVSPRHFEEFALPYQQEVYKKAQELGVKHFYTHICGEQNRNLPLWSRFSHGDPGIISIGPEIDIETAARLFPEDVVLGNVDPTLIQLGPPEKIRDSARACMNKGKRRPGGYILAPGCELPATAPPYHVWLLREAVRMG